jgi:hypothetical protein
MQTERVWWHLNQTDLPWTPPRSSPRSRSCSVKFTPKLNEAARIAEAAEACAEAGGISEGVSVSMDIEQLVYEAGRLHDTASLLNRLSS